MIIIIHYLKELWPTILAIIVANILYSILYPQNIVPMLIMQGFIFLVGIIQMYFSFQE